MNTWKLGWLGTVTLVIGVGSASADVLTPFTTTNCMENGSAVSCPFGFPPPVTGVGVFDTIHTFGTPGIDVEFGAAAGTDSASGLNMASAAIAIDFFATTAGPVRLGSMTYAIHTDGDAGLGGGFGSMASISGVDSCSGMVCNTSGTVPFTLGVPFEITMSANGFGDISSFGFDTGGSGFGEVVINLFDAAGKPVNILGPTGVPEPAHLGLGVAAFLGAGILFRRRLS